LRQNMTKVMDIKGKYNMTIFSEYMMYKEPNQTDLKKDYYLEYIEKTYGRTQNAVIQKMYEKLKILSEKIRWQFFEQQQEQEQEQEKEKEKEKNKQIETGIDLSEYGGSCNLGYKKERKNYTIDDYLNITKKILYNSNKIEHLKNVYISPYLHLYYGVSSINSEGIIVGEQFEKIKISLLNNMNFYYIVNDNKYLLISPIEQMMIMRNINIGDVELMKFMIKDKNGNSLIKQSEQIHKNEIEIFIQFLLGRRIGYKDYVDIFRYAYRKLDKFAFFKTLSCFYREYHKVKFYNESMIHYYKNKNNFDNFIDTIQKLTDTQFISMFDINVVQINKKFLEMIAIAKIKNYKPTNILTLEIVKNIADKIATSDLPTIEHILQDYDIDFYDTELMGRLYEIISKSHDIDSIKKIVFTNSMYKVIVMIYYINDDINTLQQIDNLNILRGLKLFDKNFPEKFISSGDFEKKLGTFIGLFGDWDKIHINDLVKIIDPYKNKITVSALRILLNNIHNRIIGVFKTYDKIIPKDRIKKRLNGIKILFKELINGEYVDVDNPFEFESEYNYEDGHALIYLLNLPFFIINGKFYTVLHNWGKQSIICELLGNEVFELQRDLKKDGKLYKLYAVFDESIKGGTYHTIYLDNRIQYNNLIRRIFPFKNV
jgi:hypothetical protein